MKVLIEVSGDDIASRHLREMGERAKNAKPAMQKIRDGLVESNRKQFESEGAHLGTPWEPLSPETVKRKEREGIDPRPLRGKTGDLGRSLGGGKGRRTSATKTQARAGTRVWYGAFTRGTKSGEPRRELVGMTEQGVRDAEDTIWDFVVEGHI